jgi:putative transcriptional regulator
MGPDGMSDGIIQVDLDVVMAQNKMSLTALAEKVGISINNLSILKTGKAKAIRFSTLQAICSILNCQPGDILKYIPATDSHRQQPSNPYPEAGEKYA